MIKQKQGICIDCNNGKQVPLIAKRCKNHYWQHRANLKCVGVEKKPKKIKPISDKRKKENAEYEKARLIFLSNNPKCEAEVNPNCRGRANEVHHKKGRIGTNYLDTETWLAVCRNCHIWIETHPKEAKELGLSESRLHNEN